MAERTSSPAPGPPPTPIAAGTATGSEPVLANREVCRSSSLEVIRDNLCTYYYPARVETLSRRADLSTSLLSAVRLSHTTLGFLRFGSEAMVDPGALGAYHVNVPVAGRIASECGDRQVVAESGLGAVFTPREPTTLPWWSEDSAQICIKISKAAVEAELGALVGHPVATDIRFDLGLDLATPAAASWLGVVRLLIDEVDRPGGLLERSATHREYLEKLLINGLLHLQNHDYLDELLRPGPPVRPRTVKRVMDLIETNPEINYTISDLARHAGVGARRLQISFQETVHTSPIGYLRKVKLEHARQDLLSGDESVMTVAYRWGFNHAGRFSTYYRQTYGESPSDTVRRRRGGAGPGR